MIEKKIKLTNSEIPFYDNENQGKTILMIHGNSLNAGLFHNQFKDERFRGFRLLAPDMPGHGNTGISSNPENDYSVSSYIQIIIEFINQLELKELSIFGHSLGGHSAIHVLDELTNAEIKELIICGTPPLTIPPKLEEAFLPNPSMLLAFKPDLTNEETVQLAQSFCDKQSLDFELVKRSIEDCDPLVRPMIGKSIATDLVTDESIILKNTDTTVAVLHGQNDENINRDYIEGLKLPIWKQKIVEIKNAGHSPFIENPIVFNNVLFDILHE